MVKRDSEVEYKTKTQFYFGTENATEKYTINLLIIIVLATTKSIIVPIQVFHLYSLFLFLIFFPQKNAMNICVFGKWQWTMHSQW